MRLLLLSPDFPPEVGGTQTYAYELAKRLHTRCDDFAVMASQQPGAAEVDDNLPFEIIRLTASDNVFPLAALPWLYALRRRFDTTVHVLWPSSLATLILRRLGWQGHVFVAAHARELLIGPAAYPPPLRSLYDWLRRRAIIGADGLFPVSRYTADLLKGMGASPDRIAIVHNGTDPKHFSPGDDPALRRSLGLEGKRVVLTVSRLVTRKGVDTVIRALPEVARAVPEVAYVVAGTGPDERRLRSLAAGVGVADRIHFVTAVPYRALPGYYNMCDVFAMPAGDVTPDVEGFGIVFLEANACGKPVVGARSGGIPDAIRHEETGLLVEPDDPAGLAAALIRLLTEPDLADRLGRQGRARVLAEATWDHAAERLFDALTRTRP